MFKALVAASLLAGASLAQLVSVNVDLGLLAYNETCPAQAPDANVDGQVYLYVRVNETLTGDIASPLTGGLTAANVEAQVGVCLCASATVTAGLPLQADVVADLEAQLEAAAEVALNVNRLLNTDITLTPNGDTVSCDCPAGATSTCTAAGGCSCICPNGDYNPVTGLCPPAPSGRYRQKRLSPEDLLLAPRQARKSDIITRMERRHI